MDIHDFPEIGKKKFCIILYLSKWGVRVLGDDVLEIVILKTADLMP